MTYIENPKTRGSGILAAIPQTGLCPHHCEHCFFQSGRSYLEPLEEHLPNMPPAELAADRVVRVNDGNDSSHNFELVVKATEIYTHRFFNTSRCARLWDFPAPVMLTVNPGEMTDADAWFVQNPPRTLMAVRVRTNTWNLDLVHRIVEFYTHLKVPTILTFMAYYAGDDNPIPQGHRRNYVFRKRTLNSYWAITEKAFFRVMKEFRGNYWVHSCGKLEGERGSTLCRHCGNCLREYFATRERIL